MLGTMCDSEINPCKEFSNFCQGWRAVSHVTITIGSFTIIGVKNIPITLLWMFAEKGHLTVDQGSERVSGFILSEWLGRIWLCGKKTDAF